MPEAVPTPTLETLPTEPVVAAPVVPAAPAVETTPVSPRIQALSELGFENVTDEGEAFDRLVMAYKSKDDQFAAQLREALEQVRAQAPAAAQPATPAATKKWFDPPPVDLSLVQQYRQQDGTWKAETPADIKAQAEARLRYIETFANRLVTDPEGTLQPFVEEKFNQFFEQRFGQLTAEQQEQQFFTKALAENDWIFEKDPLTKRPVAGKLTPEGARFNELMVQAHDEFGIGSRTKQFEFALRMREMEKFTSRAKQPTAAEAAALAEQKKRELLAKGGGQPNRTGSLPAPGENRVTQKNANLRFGQKLLQNLRTNGVSQSP